MSSKPRPCWPAIPSETSRASTIMPAQVASVGSPPLMAARSGSRSPTRSISMVIVVLSPPGSTMPSRPSRSSADRTARVLAPHASRARMCSAKAPCIARTPMRSAPSRLGGRPSFARPAAGSEQLFLGDGGNLEPVHRLPQPGGDLGEDLRLVEVGRRRHDRPGTLQGVLGLEDAGADEHAIDPQLHRQRGVGRRGDPAGGEVDDREAAQPLAFREQLDRGADQLGLVDQLGPVHPLQLANAGVDRARVPNGLDDVACAGFTLRPDHGRAFRDASQRLSEVATAAHERDLERVLVDVVFLVGRGEHLGLVDVVDPKRLEHLRLDEVANAALGHDRDRDRLHDRADQRRIRHPRHAALLSDVCGHAFQRHYRAGAGVLGNLGVLGSDHVHDHAALEHLGEPRLDLEGALHGAMPIPRTVTFRHEGNSTPRLLSSPRLTGRSGVGYSLSSTSVRLEAYSSSDRTPSRCRRVSISISSSTSRSGAIVRRARYASEAVPASSPRASNSLMKKSAFTAENGMPSLRTGLSLCSACRWRTTPYRWRSKVPSRWPRRTSPSRNLIATFRVGVSDARSGSRGSSTHFTAVSGIHAVSLLSRPPASSTSTRKSGSSKSRSRATPSRVSSSKNRTTTLATVSLLY